MMKLLKMDKSKSAGLVAENDFQIGLDVADDNLLQNPVNVPDADNLLVSIHGSLIQVTKTSKE